METKLLEEIKAKGLSIAEVSRRVGLNYSIVHRHCFGKVQISVKAALIYESKMGIPKQSLRPDIWE